MKRDRASLTALAVAAARALSGVDPYAHMFLPQWLAERVDTASFAKRKQAIAWLSFGLVAHIKSRTIAIDEALAQAVSRGANQVIILGAGLDSRAYRMHQLASATVYEVDHPATQAKKLESLHFMKAGARMVRHVAVDFERDSLTDALEAAGHQPNQPTVWVWEGVTMYLAPAAVRATLSVIEQRSASSSHLIVTYMTPSFLGIPLVGPLLARTSLATVGEPLRASYSPSDMRTLLARHNFDVAWDGFPSEWPSVERAGFHFPFIEERTVVAERGDT